MYYVELLRLQRAFMIYGGVVLAVFLLILIPSHWPGAVVNKGDSGLIPLSALVTIVGFCAIIFATTIGTTLNRENDGVEMVWTKPVARERLALAYIALDLAAIVVAFFLALVLAVLIFASFGLVKIIQPDDKWIPFLLLTFGIAFMWYGLLQGLTSWHVRRGGIVVGLSWALAAFVLPGLTALTMHSPGLHEVVMALNLLNPLAYLSSSSAHIHIGVSTGGPSLIPHDVWVRAAMTWGFGVLGCLAAIVGWKRLEV
jgi:hypothetical protein